MARVSKWRPITAWVPVGLGGVDMVRVHDVAAMKIVAQTADALHAAAHPGH